MLTLAVLGFGVFGFGSPASAQGSGMGVGYPGPYGTTGPGMPGPGLGVAPGTGLAPGTGCVPSGTMGPGAVGPETDLSQQQQQEIHDIRTDLYQAQLRNQQELNRALQNWQTEMTRPTPDPEAAAKAYDQVTAIQSKMLKQRLEAQNKMQQIISEGRK